nr:putative zinc-binding metallopeptidase [Sphingomonas bacterium]
MPPLGCPNCRRLIHFEARVCPACHFTLGYDPASDSFLFLGDKLTTWRDAAGEAHDVVVCANNGALDICNWLVDVGDVSQLCRACRHNHIIPDLSVSGVPERWAKIEAAKRRLIHTLLRLGLPLETRAERPDGLAFDFLYDASAEASGQPLVLTGHNGGLITLNVIEADDVQRERIRREMGEPYRTLLGHFRHEIGHHYWERLVKGTAEHEGFRLIFGDETIDYQQALQNHYAAAGTTAGAAATWNDDFVSVYACSHPWEDFAETFAHLLHMVDTLATIGGFGASLAPFPGPEAHAGPQVAFDPYTASVAELANQWIPFSFALNSINRSMGQPDLYPFHLSPTIIAKLDFVGGVVARAAGRGQAPGAHSTGATSTET